MGGGLGRARVSPAPLCPQNPGGGSGEGECPVPGWGLSIPPGAAPGGGGGRRARGRGTPGDAQSRGVSGGGPCPGDFAPWGTGAVLCVGTGWCWSHAAAPAPRFSALLPGAEQTQGGCTGFRQRLGSMEDLGWGIQGVEQGWSWGMWWHRCGDGDSGWPGSPWGGSGDFVPSKGTRVGLAWSLCFRKAVSGSWNFMH